MSSPHRRPARLAQGAGLAALAAIAASPAWAGPAPSYRALLADVAHTPRAVEASARLEAAQARARQAATRANPTVSVEVENALGDGPYEGFDSAETTVAISQTLDLWGRRRALSDTASAEADAASAQRDLATLEMAVRIARAYAEAEAAQRRLALAQEALTLSLADARAAVKMVEEGREPLLRAVQAESEAGSARARLEEARAELDVALARLTAAASLRTPPTSIDDSILDATPSASSATAPSSQPLSVRIAEAEQVAAEGRIAAERAAGRPSLTANVGFKRFEGEDASAMTLGFSAPLPLFDRNRGNVEAARADLRAAAARQANARQEAVADLMAARARARASASRVAAADASVAAAQEAYRLSRIGVDAGRISQLELRVTRSAMISAGTAAVDARLARTLASIDLARLEGRVPFGGAQ